MSQLVTLQLPDQLYQRLIHTAQATQQPLEKVILRAITTGSPPDWEDVPAEFQADIAALDRLNEDALWSIARSCKTAAELERYDDLLERNREKILTPEERLELTELRQEADRFMIRKAQAAALLRWRGHLVSFS
jgi:predicted transcriptional regulator